MNGLLILLLTAVLGFAAEPQLVRIAVPEHNVVYQLQRELRLDVVDAQARYIDAYADDAQIGRLRALGYSVAVLPAAPDAPLGTYATYAEVCSTMRYMALAYPEITRLETLGTSLGARAILVMKVTGNAGQEGNKPRIRLVGPHHGNEKIATEITLAMLKYFCENYAGNPAIRALVDTREIWIIPIFNVDGHVANRRTNNNGVDLNRDYGYEWDADTPSPFSQVETRAMRSHSEKHVINLEYEYHSTEAYVNYLWDNHPSDPPDSVYIAALAARYADSTYGTGTRLYPINGYDWYEAQGTCQDFVFGSYGGIANTIETGLPGTRSEVDNICVANRRALLDMIKLAGWGIQGLVYDSVTMTPLFARIEFTSPDRWITYTQPQVGDFHKMLPPGTYEVKVSANGYEPRTLSGVVVPDTGAVSLDVSLVPATGAPNHVQKVVIVRRNDYSHVYRDWVIRALGAPDGVLYTLGPSSSYAVFDVDPFRPIVNGTGNDLTVTATGSYTISAANDWAGPWFSLGTGTGTASFDLATVSLDSARYLKLVDAGSARLDGIAYFGSPGSGVQEPALARVLTGFRVEPNPTRGPTRIRLNLACNVPLDVSITDIAGRTVRRLHSAVRNPQSAMELTWDLRDDRQQELPDGVYFCLLRDGTTTVARKLVVER